MAWVWSWWALLAGLIWGLGARCDESCTGDGWRHAEDAWQSTALAPGWWDHLDSRNVRPLALTAAAAASAVAAVLLTSRLDQRG